jgi:ATP-dependent DNA ligase
MQFPQPNNNNTIFHQDTLIDGELNFLQTSPPQITYTCFDLIVIGGVSVVQRSLTTRLGILLEDIIKPHHHLHQNFNQPFRIEMSKHERSYGLSIILQQTSQLPTNGLIFTPVRTPYTPLKSNWQAKMYY